MDDTQKKISGAHTLYIPAVIFSQVIICLNMWCVSNTNKGRRSFNILYSQWSSISHGRYFSDMTLKDMFEAIPKSYWNLREARAKEMEQQDLRHLDLNGHNLYTKVSVGEKDTFYDTGHHDMLRAPKPLHVAGNMNVSNLVSDIESMKEAIDTGLGFDDEHVTSRKTYNADIVLKMGVSKMTQYKGQLLPVFDEIPQVEGAKPNPLEVAWRLIHACALKNEPIRGRLMNRTNGGFAVALGPVMAFCPASHVSPLLRTAMNQNRWEAKINKAIGQELWFMVLAENRDAKNIVVSHKLVPRNLLSPLLKHQSPYYRRSTLHSPTNASSEESSNGISQASGDDTKGVAPVRVTTDLRQNYFSKSQVTPIVTSEKSYSNRRKGIDGTGDRTPVLADPNKQ